MNILKSYKKTRFFLWINITGLAIGLAVSIMLILFVVNELSYDRHFADNERIVRLNTVAEERGNVTHFPINLRKAYTELPAKTPGIEAATQIYRAWKVEVIREKEHFQDLEMLYADPEFFDVFQMKFVEGTPKSALANPYTLVVTKPYAEIIFGNAAKAIGEKVSIDDQIYTVAAVVEPLPANTHFSFDLLTNSKSFPWLDQMKGMEFHTYYLIEKGNSVEEVRARIEKEYTVIVVPFGEQFNAKTYGETEMLTDIYLHSKADFSLGKTNDMKFIWILVILAALILFLAVTNFLNLFMVQGETRMDEIGIRKSNGAQIKDIVRLFFSEISLIVLIAFVLGFVLAVLITPYFSILIDKEIDLSQLANPVFIVCLVLLFVVIVMLTATYPSFYLSRFSPMDILEKRIRFSKRRLTSVVVVFQSVITIVLISFILVVNKQTIHLKSIPKGYDSENVINFMLNKKTMESYKSIKNELLKVPGIANVSGGQHLIGYGCSGQGIALLEEPEKGYSINEYRVLPGYCEMMGLELVEGEFFKEDMPENKQAVILNEAAVNMLGLSYPVVGKEVGYKGTSEIVGVVKNFIYEEPANEVQPLVLYSSSYVAANVVNIKYDTNISRVKAQKLILPVVQQFDSEFIVNPIWSEDIYAEKFIALKTLSKIILMSSLLSLFIAMMGLLAIHMYSAIRRTKEIGIRRINGAEPRSIFMTLSSDMIKWIAIAGIVAIPIAWYVSSAWLNNYHNHAGISWIIFVLPILIQLVIAVLVTSGITLKVLSRNPVEAIKAP